MSASTQYIKPMILRKNINSTYEDYISQSENTTLFNLNL